MHRYTWNLVLAARKGMSYSCQQAIKRRLNAAAILESVKATCLLERRKHFSAFDKKFFHSSQCICNPSSGHSESRSRTDIDEMMCHDHLRTEREDCGTDSHHVPVMVDKVIELLQPEKGQLFVDMTFGAGGHTRAILQKNPEARVICLDRDPLACKISQTLAKEYRPDQISPCLGKFSELPDLLECLHISPGSVDGFLFDVGASSMQFNLDHRGFSLSQDGPLDMRMDQDRYPDSITAMDVVNNLSAPQLKEIIKKYGEDRMAVHIANAIVESRYVIGKITTTKQLSEIVQSAFTGEVLMKDKINRKAHVATRTFLALRMFVNNELNELNNGLEIAFHYLREGGMCVGISFNSMEDRIFKRHFHGIDMDERKNLSLKQKFRQYAKWDHNVIYNKEDIQRELKKRWIPISKKIMTPDGEEVYDNPRSRSAKLRAATKSVDIFD